MNILVIDGATRSGYTIYQIESNEINVVPYGAIQLKENSKIPDFLRINEIGIELDKILNLYNIDLVLIEDVYGRFFNSAKFLVKLQFYLQNYFYDKGIEFKFIKVPDWHGKVESKKKNKKTKEIEIIPAAGIKKLFNVSNVSKETAVKIVQELLKDYEMDDDNIADAILIGFYYIREVMKLKQKINFTNARRIDYGIIKNKSNDTKRNSKGTKTSTKRKTK